MPSAQEVSQFLQSLGFTPVQAAGITGNLAVETGNFDPNVISGKRRGDNGTAFGMMQWRGERQSNFYKFAQEINRDPYDWRTQLMFVRAEMLPGKYSDSGSVRAYRELQKARDPIQATAAFIHAERPAGYSVSSPQSSMHFDRRAREATQTFGKASSPRTNQGMRNFGQANIPRPNTASTYGVSPEMQGLTSSQQGYSQGNYIQDDYNDIGSYSDGTGYNNPYQYSSRIINPLGNYSDFEQGSMFNLTSSGYLGLNDQYNYDNTGYLRQFGAI